jgi:hypothetical protein
MYPTIPADTHHSQSLVAWYFLQRGDCARNVRIAVARPQGGLLGARSPDGTIACIASVVTEGQVAESRRAKRVEPQCIVICSASEPLTKLQRAALGIFSRRTRLPSFVSQFLRLGKSDPFCAFPPGFPVGLSVIDSAPTRGIMRSCGAASSSFGPISANQPELGCQLL